MPKDKKLTLSVGSDESGNEGLFGGCSFAAFRLNQKNLEILKQQKWFEFLITVMDAKKMDYYWVTFLAQEIKKLFENEKDFFIWDIEARRYNEMFDIYKDFKEWYQEIKIKSIAHNYIHGKLKDGKDPIKHVLDDFLEDKAWIYRNAPWGAEIVNIDDFCKEGERKYLSISIASILAKDSYLEQFRQIQMELGFSIYNRKGYNHDPSPKNLKDISKVLETKKLNKNHYCKKHKLKQYEKNLKNFLNLKKSLTINY